MERERQHLTARVIELRNAIRRKYKAFKNGTQESEILLEKQYKPIITELRKETQTKLEPKEDLEDIKHETPRFLTSSPKHSVSYEEDMEVGENEEVSQNLQETSNYVKENYNAPVTQKYILQFLKDVTGRKMDHIYGPRVSNDDLLIGDSKISFDDYGNIYVKGTSYGNTDGLYELVFMKNPDSDIYTEEDLDAYKHLLAASNAHKKSYQFNNNINRLPNSIKYKAVIADLFPKPAVYGKGMIWKNTKSRDIMHWDNPNELVERLIHITMSTESGNRVHSNEIVSIIEELREAGYIKGRGNSRFASLLK